MKLGDMLNKDRVNALQVDKNAYASGFVPKQKENNVKAQDVQKVLFPEPYQNARPYYNRSEFDIPKPPPEEHHSPPRQNNFGFDFKSILPMLMSGKFNDVLKPLMSMLGGGGNSVGGLGDMTKIFELFKPKTKKDKKEKKEDEDISSKFDDMIII